MTSPGPPFATIALIGRYATPGIAEPLGRLAAFLTARGHRVILDAETAEFTPLPGYPTASDRRYGRATRRWRSWSEAMERCFPSLASSLRSTFR